jgi:hypothetical protein
MNLKPNYIVIFGEEEACVSFRNGESLGRFLNEPKNKFRPKKIVNLSQPKRWSEPIIEEEV